MEHTGRDGAVGLVQQDGSVALMMKVCGVWELSIPVVGGGQAPWGME